LTNELLARQLDVNSFIHKMLRKSDLCLIPPMCSKTTLVYHIKAGFITFASAEGHKKPVLELFVGFLRVLVYGVAGQLSLPIICKMLSKQNSVLTR